MLVTKEIEKVFIVRMTEDQADLLIQTLKKFALDRSENVEYTCEQLEVFSDLRESLLNA